MPHTPDPQQGDRQEGEFADLFARKARTPLRGFLPGRRVWNAVGGSAAAVLVIVGSASAVSAIDWSAGDSDKVTSAADKEAPQEREHADTAEKPTTAPSGTDSRGENSGRKNPEVVYVPVSGGAGAGAGAGAAASTPNPGPTDSTEGASGSTVSKEEQSSSPTNRATPPGTTTSYLWSDGSVDTADDNAYWDQSVVTVKSTKPLSSLKVVIKIIQTGGVAGTGTWSSLGDKVSVATGASSGELDYVVTLKAGNTLDPGTYVFKFQYNHDQGNRAAGGDRYNVTAVATDSDDKFRAGGF
ncbi:hypothetical protein [Streptomyces sp. NBC_00576]|uniref:hypothetical protein n=1 Tax=Streptomyces sp. NBC_00576 TaxID=2903665 RepID=UPI002E807BC7|nr:hypothetical protein [Streptomyces sp. NBC_00576]WUB70917.1 hypothetical protein OG734_12925 [Streptomyces sp. NBC_00576]